MSTKLILSLIGCARDLRSAPFANQKVPPPWVTGAKLANYFFSPYCFCNF